MPLRPGCHGNQETPGGEGQKVPGLLHNMLTQFDEHLIAT